MNTNIEKEYKVLLNQEQFMTLSALYPDLSFRKQVNTYYDTADMKIRSIRGAMRIRKIDDYYIFTLKLFKGDDLFEYECEVKENSPAVFLQDEIRELLDQHELHGPFHELTTLTTYRGMVCTPDAEICFDKSYYNNQMDYEIEYEYKREHDGLRVFQQILDHVSINYEKNCTSKIRRAIDSIR